MGPCIEPARASHTCFADAYMPSRTGSVGNVVAMSAFFSRWQQFMWQQVAHSAT